MLNARGMTIRELTIVLFIICALILAAIPLFFHLRTKYNHDEDFSPKKSDFEQLFRRGVEKEPNEQTLFHNPALFHSSDH